MLNLNLLPPKERIDIAFEMKSRAVLAVGSGLIFVAVVAIALLLPTFFLLVFQKGELEREVELELAQGERAGVAEGQKQIEHLNRLARAAASSETQGRSVFAMLEIILRDVPPSLRLESLRFRVQEKNVVLSGFAPARAVMLEFLQALERNPEIVKVDSPVANIIKESDIKFSVTVTVK